MLRGHMLKNMVIKLKNQLCGQINKERTCLWKGKYSPVLLFATNFQENSLTTLYFVDCYSLLYTSLSSG